MCDKNNRPFPFGLTAPERLTPRGRGLQPKQALQLVYCPRHPRPLEQQDVVWAGVDMVFDDPLGFFIGGGHGGAGNAGGGVGIARERTKLLGQLRFNWPIQTAAGCPIGIPQRLDPVRRHKWMPVADRIFPVNLEFQFLCLQQAESPPIGNCK
ncbi:hypothetical protein D3C81_840770 [compost metagenome]